MLKILILNIVEKISIITTIIGLWDLIKNKSIVSKNIEKIKSNKYNILVIAANIIGKLQKNIIIVGLGYLTYTIYDNIIIIFTAVKEYSIIYFIIIAIIMISYGLIPKICKIITLRKIKDKTLSEANKEKIQILRILGNSTYIIISITLMLIIYTIVTNTDKVDGILYKNAQVEIKKVYGEETKLNWLETIMQKIKIDKKTSNEIKESINIDEVNNISQMIDMIKEKLTNKINNIYIPIEIESKSYISQIFNFIITHPYLTIGSILILASSICYFWLPLIEYLKEVSSLSQAALTEILKIVGELRKLGANSEYLGKRVEEVLSTLFSAHSQESYQKTMEKIIARFENEHQRLCNVENKLSYLQQRELEQQIDLGKLISVCKSLKEKTKILDDLT